MPAWVSLLTIVVAFFIITVAPGPATLANASVAMSHGRKAGLRFALGLSLGLMFLGAACSQRHGRGTATIGLRPERTENPGRSVSAVAGAGGHQAFTTRDKRWFWRGLLLNLSNPQAVLAWMAALAVGMSAQSDLSVLGTALLLCLNVTLLVYASYMLIFLIRSILPRRPTVSPLD